MVERIGNFHLSNDKEDEIQIDDVVCKRILEECSASLVGKLLTLRRFNVVAMKESLRRAWGMFEKLTIVEVGDNLFHFRFDDETSLLKVFNGGPWNLPSSPSMMSAAIEAQSGTLQLDGFLGANLDSSI